ncbi:glycosyltransferase, partial [Kaarinaea lacus]
GLHLRILMLSDVYFPRINGVSTSIKTFKSELEALGHYVILVAPDYGNNNDHDSSIIRIPSLQVPRDPEDRFMKWRHIFNHTEHFKQQQFDVIHVQTPFIAHYVGISLSRQLNLPIVESYHTYFEEYLYHYVPFLPKAFMKSLARRFTRAQCNSMDAIVVPSTAMLAVLRDYGVSCKAEIIPTGLELNKFQNGNGVAFREKYNIPANRPTITIIGRVAFEKNIDFLLRVVKEVRKTIADVLLVVAGEGPALHSLKQLTLKLDLSNNVLFVGYLDRDSELLDCYRGGDVFVFASNTETQGLVLLEAMALGIPLVSTAVMGTKDILAPQQGALIAEETVEDFAAKVQTLLGNTLLRQKLSEEASSYAKQWSASAMAEKLVGFYQKVVVNRISKAA